MGPVAPPPAVIGQLSLRSSPECGTPTQEGSAALEPEHRLGDHARRKFRYRRAARPP